MQSETSASGSMFIETNGKKSTYSWNGKLTRAPKGVNVQANVTMNGKSASLNLKNKSITEIRRDPQFLQFFKKLQTTRRARSKRGFKR